MVRLANPGIREIGRHVNDYPSAAKFLGDKGSRKLANNTKVYRVMLGGYYGLQDEIHVRLHNTDIVSYRADGVITLNSGGYRTVTTKQRINQLLPPGWDVYQKKHKWYVVAPNGEQEDFFDGMKIQYHTRGTGEKTSHPIHSRFGSRRLPIPSKANLSEEERAHLLSLSRQMDKPDYPGHQPNPGKFSDTVEEMLYQIDHDQTIGSVDELGWYGLVSGLLYREAEEFVRDSGDLDVREFAHDSDSYDWPLNAIIAEDSDGSIQVETFKNNRDALRQWAEVQRMYDKYYRQSDGSRSEERHEPF